MRQKSYVLTLVRILHILFNGTNSLSPAHPHNCQRHDVNVNIYVLVEMS